jgi:uncharacterized protein YukE
MQLSVDTESLRAAAAALDACARRLDGDAQSFRLAASRAVPDVGREAVTAAGQSSEQAVAAARTLVADLDQLARALRLLSELYAAADAGAAPTVRGAVSGTRVSR